MKGEEVIEELRTFVADRFEKIPEPHRGKPCLAESWWVEEILEQTNYCFPRAGLSREQGLRFCWRYARAQRIGLAKISGGGCPNLLLHQINDLHDAIFGKALEIIREQRRERMAA